MTRILAIADEVEDQLYVTNLKELEIDLVVSCGDLPFDYLESMVTIANVPLVFIPGNHDPDLKRRSQDVWPEELFKPFSFRRDHFVTPGPEGCVNIDGRVVWVKGLRIAGLGGSPRYTDGPNQYTQAEMRFRAARLEIGARLRSLLPPYPTRVRGVDVLLTHAPPLGVGDEDDPAHTGFKAFHGLVKRLKPRLLVHGHVHPYGKHVEDLRLEGTDVINAVGHRIIELDAQSSATGRRP